MVPVIEVAYVFPVATTLPPPCASHQRIVPVPDPVAERLTGPGPQRLAPTVEGALKGLLEILIKLVVATESVPFAFETIREAGNDPGVL